MNQTFTFMKGGDFRLLRWVEIEGLPYAFGSAPGDLGSSFFSGRAAAQQFDGIKAFLKSPAPIEDVELDVLEAFPKHAAELQTVIVDVDGTVCALVNTDPGPARLSADYSAGATSIVYVGSDPGFGAGPGIAYIGNETIRYGSHNAGTKTLSSVTRGCFRSVARAWGRGIPIAIQPYTLAKRRVWYYLCANYYLNGPGASNFGFAETDKWLRFAGTLESFRASEDLGAFEFRAISLEKELDRTVFGTLRNFKGPLDSKIRGRDSTEGIDVYGQWQCENLSPQTIANEFLPVRVDDEIMMIERIGSTEFLRIVGRGLFNTAIEEHAAGCTMKEVAAICTGIAGDHAGSSPSSNLENFASHFYSYPDPGSYSDGGGTTFLADHPLAILLQVMLTGGPGGADGNGWSPPLRSFALSPTNTLPDWFLGIDPARLDLAAICKLANETAWLRVSGIIEDPVNFIEFARALLRPFGFYATYTAEGLLTVKPTRPPMPASNLRNLSDKERIRGSRPGYDANLSAVVSEVEYKFGWDISRNKFRRIVVLRVNEGDLYSGGRGRRLSYESKLLYTGSDRIPGELTKSIGLDVVELLRQRGDFFRSRYSRPPAIIEETVSLDMADVALGDLVQITSANLPDPKGGTRGLTSVIAEVIGKRLDEIEKTIELRLLLTGYSLADYRVIGWSGIVSSYSDGGINFTTNNDGPGTKNGGRAAWYDYADAAPGTHGNPQIIISGNTFMETQPGVTLAIYDNIGTPTEPRWNFASPTFVACVTAGLGPDRNEFKVNTTWSKPTNNIGALVRLATMDNNFGVIVGTKNVAGIPTNVEIEKLFAHLANNSGEVPIGVPPDSPGHKLFPS